ncbi:MAG: transglycosylase domain-containing protein [Flavobacteriales bacterium]|nr:MAG: penicillin-binding protein [Flavobacteriales bacterium]MBX2958973.1 transglycosylase domain-containing protein [Flavobacteriales bacterium]
MSKKSGSSLNQKKVILYFWLLCVFLPLFLFFIIMLGAKTGTLGFDPLPSLQELENPKSNLASEIISSDGKVFGKYFKENRTTVKYTELSPNLVNALVATEDERFYNHSGIDFRGLLRAVVKLGRAGGASTITQQLAKMMFEHKASNIFQRIKQKLQEQIIAVELEKRYTKEEIITMYLNKFDFINNAVGIKSASNVYFNKEPIELEIQEAAMLVGMAKNPALFNPLRRPEMTQTRREVVLKQMEKNDFITEEQYDSLRVLPLGLDYKIVDHKEGIAPYFREVLRSDLQKLFEQKDEDGNYLYAKKDGTPYNIYSDGLKIYTTIDSRMQTYAEWAVQEHIGKTLQNQFFNHLKKYRKKKYPFDSNITDEQYEQIMQIARARSLRYQILTGKECENCGRRGKFIEKDGHYFQCTAEDCNHRRWAPSQDSIPIIFDTPTPMKVFTYQGDKDTIMSPNDSLRYYKSFLQAGLMAVDPHTGYIKAWVGGTNFANFSFDHVKMSRRQVGSTFKPFVYSLAIQNGYSPCHEVTNTRYTFHKGEFGILQDWTPKNSDGLYGCNVSLKYALANSMNTITAWIMKQFGPQAVVNQAKAMGITSPLEAVPSLCLGVADLSVYEMVGANATMANKGVYIEPTMYTRIEDKHGNVIVDFKPKTNEAMSEETAYVMLDLMKGVVDGERNNCIGSLMKNPRNVSGTGMRLRGSITESRPYTGHRYPIAGKTGTTQNNSDGWFMGLTPDLVTGVWVGAEERSIRFATTDMGQGANTALPIWGYFMQKVHADPTLKISSGDFEKPEQPLSIELDCAKYNLSNGLNNDFNDTQQY